MNNRVATAPQQAFDGLLPDTWLLVGVDAGFVLRERHSSRQSRAHACMRRLHRRQTSRTRMCV